MTIIRRARLLFTFAALAGTMVVSGCGESSGTNENSTEAVPAANVQPKADTPPANPATTDLAIERSSGPRSAVALPAATAGPVITFKETVHDLGEIWDTEDQSFDFEFTNTGGSLLIIDSVKASCGCTTPRLDKKEYAPGESGTIGIRFDPKGHGEQTKYLTVTSNSLNQPELKLYIKSFIKELVTLDPHIVTFHKYQVGQTHSQLVTVTSADPNLEITSIKPNSPLIQARLVNDEAGPAPRNSADESTQRFIEVTISDNMPWGRTFGAVEVMTRGRVRPGAPLLEHRMTLTVNAILFGEVIVDPFPIQFGVVPDGGTLEKPVTLTSRSGKPFGIVSAEFVNCPITGLQADLQPVPGGGVGHTIRVHGPAGDFRGVIRGTLRVVTDVPGEPPLELQLLGRVGPIPPELLSQ